MGATAPTEARRLEHNWPSRLARFLASDRQKAFAFYSELFGWQSADADIGDMGTYQLFSSGGQAMGGMVTRAPVVPAPFWLSYFNVGDVDAAARRVKAAGGQRDRGCTSESEDPRHQNGSTAWHPDCLRAH